MGPRGHHLRQPRTVRLRQGNRTTFDRDITRILSAGGRLLQDRSTPTQARISGNTPLVGLEAVVVSVLDQDREIAVVKVAWDIDSNGQVGSVDYLSMAKADDRWQAVNILWQDDRSDGDDVINEADAPGWIL